MPLPITLATCRLLPALTASDAVLQSALESRGADVVVAPWQDIDPTGSAALVCPRSTWDYFHCWPEFRRWLESFDARPVLWNPLETLLWNADKRYLRELKDAGIALPFTRWFEPGERPDTDAFLRLSGTPRAVLKPRVSGAAYATHVMEAGTRLSDEQWAPLEAVGSLLQAFVSEIVGGEVSLVYLDGEFSHAAHKLPAAGDYRVQVDHGGTVKPFTPDAALCAFADRVLSAVSHPWLYARVDTVRTARGPVLMELELLEPDLFFTEAPAAAERLADALILRAGESVNSPPASRVQQSAPLRPQ
jgi:glutathione synthase/RimK-type ligase-like ATP-grasp enzyme